MCHLPNEDVHKKPYMHYNEMLLSHKTPILTSSSAESQLHSRF